MLAFNHLDGFEALWAIQLDWFEEPNYRREGWSGVARHVLNLPGKGSCAVFIKRQENHNYKSLLHPVSGLPTIFREYRNICGLKKRGIPSPDPVFYGQRVSDGQYQAILVTRALDGFSSLEDFVLSAEGEDEDEEDRRAVIDSAAATVEKLHRHFFQHGCLYGKHIFVKIVKDGKHDEKRGCVVDSRVIDLEKMRRRFPRFSPAIHDLDKLYRHWQKGEGDWEAFLQAYFSRAGLGLWEGYVRKAIKKRSGRKQKRLKPGPSHDSPPA